VTLGTFPDEGAAPETEPTGRASLGMTLRDLSPTMAERMEMPRGTSGVLVTDVEAGEAAENAGIVRGDVIVAVNGEPVAGVAEFDRAVEAARPAGRARLRVYNAQAGGGYRFVVLKLK
jgi:serine protease Do